MQRLALIAASLCVLLAATEAVLRRFDLPRFDACSATADFAIPDPELGFAGPPGGTVAGRQLNAMGLRGPVLEQPKPPGRFRVLYLGDSTAWGLGVPLEETFAARTTALLAADLPERTFDFAIGAFPGYSTYHSRVLLRRLLPLEPDLVVFYVGARNDPTRHRYFRDADIPARRARLEAGWHQVRLLRLLEATWDRLYKSVLRKVLGLEARARVPLEDFRANVSDMSLQLRRAGAQGVVVLPPLSLEFVEREPLAPAYRDALAEEAWELGLPVVALQTAFDAETERKLYFEDGYHFAAGGHVVSAREIHEAVLRVALGRRSVDEAP